MSEKEEKAKNDGDGGAENSNRVDGDAFLAYLRADAGMPAHNDDTLGASNKAPEKHRRDMSSLSDLFDHPVENSLSASPNGGAPIMSTKLPPRPPSSMHSRGRSVSWGNNHVHPPNLMQPNLGDAPSFPSGEEVPRYTVNDVLGYEQEAETNILRALEDHQARRGRADTGTSSILSSVPDDVAHDFTLSPSVDHSQDESESAEPPLSERGARLLQREQSRKLLHRKNPLNAHRRTMSVEQTLAGLTDAMSALDDARSHQVETIEEEEKPPSSSADQLAQNAAFLTRHDEDEHTRPSPKERWSHLLNNLPTLKEAAAREEIDDTMHNSEDSNEQEGDVDDLEAGNPAPKETAPSARRTFRKPKGLKTTVNAANNTLNESWVSWTSFFQPRKEHVWSYVKFVVLYVIIPLTGIAAILFYLVDNPPTGISQDGSSGDQASSSWWLLFVVRQVITFSLALFMQLLIIDFLALGTKVVLRLCGPILTLLIVQSKGYPFVVFWWSIFDFCMLYGGDFAKHWLFWQDPIRLFNASNPSGNVVNDVWNMRILTIAISVSAAVAVKRFLVGLYMARQTYAHYGQKLARVMNKMLLVSEVAGLSKEIEKSSKNRNIAFPVSSENFGKDHFSFVLSPVDDDDSTTGTANMRESSIGGDGDNVIDMTNRDPLTGSLHRSEKLKIMQLLERWEEPDRHSNRHLDEVASISAVLRFRNALAMMEKQYPFSYAFGLADTREAFIESAQKVYTRLLLQTPDNNVLHFHTLALLALQKDGTIDQQKAKDLVKLFRPDRQGNLTMLDFLRSADRVYKEYRLLQASIQNSSRIDESLEKISNWIFYTVVLTIILATLDLDPLAIFLSLSSIVLAFAFMIGSASSKYFEGLLFILVRRPYNIGDLINVSNVEVETSFDGAPGWIVENVTLFETECTWLPTNERASLSNGSLANSRIINWTRSPHAQFHIWINFPINTPYEKILVFKSAVEEYMKARPREWLSLNGFRANKIYPEKGFVEYALVIMHRDGWQMVGQVLDSKANLSSYCMEVTKQLGLNYRAPPLPVDLTYSKALGDQKDTVTEEMDNESRLQDARSIVHKHNIRVC